MSPEQSWPGLFCFPGERLGKARKQKFLFYPRVLLLYFKHTNYNLYPQINEYADFKVTKRSTICKEMFRKIIGNV